MKLIIHDLDITQFETLFSSLDEGIEVISNNDKIRHCTGCFGCRIKTPGVCVLKDAYNEMGKNLHKQVKLYVLVNVHMEGIVHLLKMFGIVVFHIYYLFFLKKWRDTS